MGTYFNPPNKNFSEAAGFDYYVDKSGILGELNKMVETPEKYVCVSRPRRFGKTITANMLSAYYNRMRDSAGLFAGLAIAHDPSYESYLNKFHVIFLDIGKLLSRSGVGDMIDKLDKTLTREIQRVYPDIPRDADMTLPDYINELYEVTGIGMVIIIDEWDCIFRERKDDTAAHGEYLKFLREFLKDQPYISLVYMTGILPIKKYGSHSALGMFHEFSMTEPKQFDRFIGFNADEVRSLCDRYGMDFLEMAAWYDGYSFPHAPSVFNPRAVVAAFLTGSFSSYWTQTETFEALKAYILMDYDGLGESVVSLLAGGKVRIKTDGFTNDMVTFQSKDDVLTLLVHLGYLGYLADSSEVFVPNKEISKEFVTAMGSPRYQGVTRTVNVSSDLLKATWSKDSGTVASLLEKAHEETSHLTYNDENALAYTVSLAYLSAKDYYTVVREMPSGKVFADLIFLPMKSHLDKPAMVVELKWNKTAEGAIKQIKEKNYPAVLKDQAGKILLVGINYAQSTKKHSCVIEEI
ncbi:MAG: ATP-binding protein [Lachnospiraceae bacterium]|nr:ATP-binding protein [Lachnospiraceae bacterium]